KMAAAGGGGAAVSVLAPSGRRVTVRVGPGTVLLQALFSFRFQRNVLDLSLQWRFARLPNNAKLEMVPVSNRAGAGTTVRIALQLDDGSRFQDTFLCQQTLWELLNHFAKIRVVMKKCSSSGGEEVVGAMVPCNEPTVKQGSVEEAVDVPLPQANTFPKDLEHRDVAVSLSSCTHKQDSVKDSDASLEELWNSPEPEPTPFVPFSGGGEHLGDSPVPSSKLPKTFSSPGGPSKPKKSKSSQELQKKQEQLVEREPLICHLDLLEQLPDDPEELPDEFFEVTVDDVRKRLAQLQNERKRLEEAPLLTKSLRESQLKEKLERYPKVVLRVCFPDRHVLQGFFHPTETGKTDHPFNLCCCNSWLPPWQERVSEQVFLLPGKVKLWSCFITCFLTSVVAPPRIILNDESLTLFEVRTHTWALILCGLCSP
uniref:ASPSCR1 tether for SLC2A4, UBX domain containing n=1 Tax=Catharus ustulatus TaxID=91951 RepID=A0A8C3UXE8_CATUS